MTSSEPIPPVLHELEALVMDELWRQAPVTVRDVMDVLNQSAEKPRAYTTYMTILARLHRKGLLDRWRKGKTDLYAPRLSREQYAEARAGGEIAALVQQYGDVALAHFARHIATLDPERQKRLRRLARRA